MRPPLTVSAVLSDAWDVYRLLFRRSFPIAVAIYAVINLVDPVGGWIDNDWVAFALGAIAFVLTFAGPVLVQGALVKIVQSVHEAVRPQSSRDLLADAWRRVVSLVAASLVYSIGLVIGLVLLIVPGLIVAARWALMAPAIMLEGHPMIEAQARSRRIVVGEIANGLGDRTWFAFGVVFSSFLIASAPAAILAFLVDRQVGGVVAWIVVLLVSGLTAPFEAHVLSVLYYRLVEPERPAIDPQVRSWPSVWAGPIPEHA